MLCQEAAVCARRAQGSGRRRDRQAIVGTHQLEVVRCVALGSSLGSSLAVPQPRAPRSLRAREVGAPAIGPAPAVAPEPRRAAALGDFGNGPSGGGGTAGSPQIVPPLAPVGDRMNVVRDECPGVVPAETVTVLQGPSPAAGGRWLYPYDETVFPRGLDGAGPAVEREPERRERGADPAALDAARLPRVPAARRGRQRADPAGGVGPRRRAEPAARATRSRSSVTIAGASAARASCRR